MQRIKPTATDRNGAAGRLLLAVVLSIVLHGLVVWFGPGPAITERTTGLRAGIITPQGFALFASLQHSVPLATRPTLTAGAVRRSNALERLDTPDPRYYRPDELDVLPMPRQPIQLPQATPQQPLRLLARIDASGRVTDVSVFDSAAIKTQEAQALTALRQTRFLAARRDGRAVRAQVVIEIMAAAR